jgi:hypothetical protein
MANEVAPWRMRLLTWLCRLLSQPGDGTDGVSDNDRDRPVLRKPYQPDAMAHILSDLLNA